MSESNISISELESSLENPAPHGRIVGKDGKPRALRLHDVFYEKIGIPYTQERALAAATIFATDTCSIRRLVNKYADFPSIGTIRSWRNKYPEFEELWVIARQIRSDNMVDESQDIVEECDPDHQFGSARVSHAKLRMTLRHTLARFLNPDDYGTSSIQARIKANVNFSFHQLTEMAGEVLEAEYESQEGDDAQEKEKGHQEEVVLG